MLSEKQMHREPSLGPPPPRRPRVSVGVPVYNGEPFIGEALDAIAAQTFGDYEVIISDNASTDGTERICREYATRDPRVRYVRNERNIGLARNFQQLVRLASGEYFKLANADDVPAPRLVDECVAVLDAHPEVVLCYGKTILIDHQGRHLRPHTDGLHLRDPSARARFRVAVERTGLVNLLQGVIRTAALRRTAMLGTFTASDMVLVAELSLHGQFHELPEVLFYRRLHAAALSSVTTAEGLQGVWDPLKATAERLIAWRHYRAYAGAIARAPISVTDKLTLFRWLARQGITGRRRLLLELLAAAGVGSKIRS
jgi:glycosyltransferase involved in cell wall biosynthesis